MVASRQPEQPSGFVQSTGLLLLTLGAGICLMMGAVGVGLLAHIERSARPTATPIPTLPRTLSAPVVAVLPSPSPSPERPIPDLPPAYAATVAPTVTDLPHPMASPTATPADAPQTTGQASGCEHPEGWELHHVLPGETLFAYVLGAGGTVTTDDLRRANCLSSDLLQIGQPLYLPPGAAQNAPPSEPLAPAAPAGSGPRSPDCDPHCTISIRPGWRAEQIAAVIDSLPVGFWGADFLAAVGPGAAPPAYDFLASRPAGRSLEGYLYPGTYELSNEDTAESFRDRLLAAFAEHLPADASALAAAHGMTLYQALTLASIIQRESWAYGEQVLVSSVFHNRLQAGSPLGSTVTLQYALGGPGDWWPRLSASHFDTASPYNTNLNAGLPPSPVCNPAAEAINAALRPAETDYLFFTGNCQGSGNLYATTYEEHLANVNACR